MKILTGKPFRINIPINKSNSKKFIEMVWIDSGIFSMGTPINDEVWLEENNGSDTVKNKLFSVTLTNGFWLSKTKICIQEWELIKNKTIQEEENRFLPKTGINYYEILDFCDVISDYLKSGLPVGYRFGLPTEAQWEFACRAGDNSNKLHFPNSNSNTLDEVSWYRKNSNYSLQPVGQKKPNSWGLEGMQSNCWEWCNDYLNDYPYGEVHDWEGKSKSDLRVVRGAGYWSESDSECFDYSNRFYQVPSEKDENIGFRICLRSQSSKNFLNKLFTYK